MSGIDGSDAVVRVVRGAHTEAEGACSPEWGRPPMIVVVPETVHTL